jgi:hypothetical protein
MKGLGSHNLLRPPVKTMAAQKASLNNAIECELAPKRQHSNHQCIHHKASVSSIL